MHLFHCKIMKTLFFFIWAFIMRIDDDEDEEGGNHVEVELAPWNYYSEAYYVDPIDDHLDDYGEFSYYADVYNVGGSGAHFLPRGEGPDSPLQDFYHDGFPIFVPGDTDPVRVAEALNRSYPTRDPFSTPLTPCLPNDVLTLIFEILPPDDKCRFGGVNKFWRDIARREEYTEEYTKHRQIREDELRLGTPLLAVLRRDPKKSILDFMNDYKIGPFEEWQQFVDASRKFMVLMREGDASRWRFEQVHRVVKGVYKSYRKP